MSKESKPFYERRQGTSSNNNLNSNSEPTPKVRLEIGAGKAPKAGYVHNDINPFDHIEYICNAWEVPLPENSCIEVLADGVVEHLTRAQARMLFKKVYQILAPGGGISLHCS